MNKELIKYIREQRRKGATQKSIQQELLRGGWQPGIVRIHLVLLSPVLWWTLATLVLVLAGIIITALLWSDSQGLRSSPIASSLADDQEALNLALINSDRARCEKIWNAQLRGECEASFTPREECDLECKNRETLNIALARNDVTMCGAIDDPSLREQCQIALGGS